MQPLRVQFRIRTLFVIIAAVAVLIGFLRPWQGVDVRTDEQAVEIAAALVMRGCNLSARKHRAKVYQECGTTPLLVDFYPNVGTYVAKRVGITANGAIRGPATFTQEEGVRSFRDGPGMYLLDRTAKVIALVPHIIGPDGEVADANSIAPIPEPSP